MDSLNQSSQKIPSLRTYAKDLERTRKEKSLPTHTAISEEITAKASTVTRQKKEPLITAVPVPPPKFTAHKEDTKAAPALKPIPVKTSQPKLPSFTAPSNTTFIVDNEDAAEATIITDTKHDRFKLLPSLFTSIKEWFTDQKKARAVKNAPKYTVPETSRRKGVIQKATGATGKSATADFASIQERIKQRKAQVQKVELHTTWSANTEPVFLLLEEEVANPVTNVQLVSRKSFRTDPVIAPDVIPDPEPVVIPVPPPITKPVVIPAPVPAPVIVPAAPVALPPPVVVPAAPVAPPVVVAPAPEKIAAEVPEPINTNKAVAESEELDFSDEFSSRYRLLSLNTNLLSLSISGIALILIIVITLSYAVVTKQPEVATLEIPSPTALLQTSTFSSIPETSLTRETLVTKLTTLASDQGMISEFVFTDSKEVAFTPQQIISTLGFSTEQSFTQAIKTIHFGYIENTEPYVLMEVTNEIATKGGLLLWEDSLYTDFTSIFSREAEALGSSIKFIDGTFGGADVRILKDVTGRDVLIYGMLGTDVLITTNSSTFNIIANLIQ